MGLVAVLLCCCCYGVVNSFFGTSSSSRGQTSGDEAICYLFDSRGFLYSMSTASCFRCHETCELSATVCKHMQWGNLPAIDVLVGSNCEQQVPDNGTPRGTRCTGYRSNGEPIDVPMFGEMECDQCYETCRSHQGCLSRQWGNNPIIMYSINNCPSPWDDPMDAAVAGM